ncbi:probable cation-transporting ATPase 13A4 [Xenopus laevis]|uniref:Cation-transporting ATPase n=1 Tax=Xenopus laevis TaxID=8355 RepID=A0A8J1KSK1_XENLA|nr:probable cation-transporting ATPase 13A4 [Xenopus laevis]
MQEKPVLLNQGEDSEMELFGYKTVRWRHTLCIIGYIFSLGFLQALFYWKPELDVWCQCIPCSLSQADVILRRSTDEHKQYYKKEVKEICPCIPGSESTLQIITGVNSIISKSLMKQGKIRYIEVQKIRYVWNTVEGQFQKTGILEEELSCTDIHSKFGSGLTQEEQELRQQVCGLNKIEVEIKPIWVLLFTDIFNPFYVFQAYTLTVWALSGYFYNGGIILSITFLSICATLYSLRKESGKLQKMAQSYNSTMVNVLQKNGEVKEVESQSLVPGDVILLTGSKLFLPCDAILISGVCTNNEGMLTGESIPVTKNALPHTEGTMPWKIQCGEDYKRHILFCGTEVVQTKAQGQDLVKAVVLQTGFNTAKGDLIRAILYNKPVNIKLHREAIQFIYVLVGIALCGVIYTSIVYTINGESVRETVLRSLHLLTQAVNAALPASLTINLLYAQKRLKKLGIFCISPQRINIAGKLNLVCFDKTGTLTEDSLDLCGVVPSDGHSFQKMHCFPSGETLPWGPLLGAMASCHSLITLNGELQGDPLDMKMFEGTSWELENHSEHGTEESISCTMVKPGPRAGKVPVEGIAILHQFPFSSALQRMSVITQVTGESNLMVFMKGAPEMVIRFCKPETVPLNVSKKLEFYTGQGFRVIGLGYRLLEKEKLQTIQHVEREEVETDLIFLGLLILENSLKPETTGVLQELTNAKIRSVMSTGDNLQTAVNIGVNCGMIPKSSKIIIIEAKEPQKDSPAEITWKTMIGTLENGHKESGSHFDISDEGDHYTFSTETFHFATDGKSFQILLQHFYNLVPKILQNGTVFARMTPRQKSILIEEFQKLDYCVGMCGDGANDCGALKMASVGISVSQLEASVASPFTSNIPNISCVPLLIKEGRNSLVTSFYMFKFLTMITLVEMTSLVILFWKQKMVSESHYLLQDFALTIPISFIGSLNGPAPKLAPYRPSGRIMSPSLLLSVFLHSLFTIILQTTAFVLLQQQPWYNETDISSACLPLNQSTENITMRVPDKTVNYITTMEWIVTSMNIVILEFVLCKGRPFRQYLYTNYMLTLVITIHVAVYIFLLFANIESIYLFFEAVCTPYYWRVYIFFMLLIHFVISYTVEEGILENRKLWILIKRLCNYESKSQYKKLQSSLEMDTEWPPHNRTDYASKSVSVTDSKTIVFTDAPSLPAINSGKHGTPCRHNVI